MVATGGGGPGLFTNSKPGDRKIVPDDVGDREVFKVVYVVLESQYQASLSTACKRINAGQPDVAVEVTPPRHARMDFRQPRAQPIPCTAIADASVIKQRHLADTLGWCLQPSARRLLRLLRWLMH